MPYTPPAPAVALPVHSAGRTGHRRSYTVDSPGAFAPLGALPRRRSKTVFHLSNDDDDDEESADDDNVLRNIPPIKLKQNNSFNIPFPRTSPTLPSTTSLPPTRPNVIRTASNPIILSTGKPLKSSLKSSTSSPHIPPTPSPSVFPQGHARARSAPSTPSLELPIHKNVHFPTNDLATVRIFNRSAKPASLSRPAGEETETETEGEQSTGNSGFIRPTSAFPFPRSPLSQEKSLRYEVDSYKSSAIPSPNPLPTANVYLESLSFDFNPTQKITPGLSGSLLVRNIAYEKQVAVRFTLDDWQTTSEVTARHLVSLPVLPTSFVEKKQLSYTHITALPAPPSSPSSLPQWDRFAFHIKLEDYAFKLVERTLFLVVRYNANAVGGNVESWDNNCGANYKIAFRETVVAPSTTPTAAPRGRVFAVSSPPAFAPTITNVTPAHITSSPQHAAMVAQTTLLRLKKLNLRNYAAPSSSSSSGTTSTSEVAVQGRNSRQLSTEMEMEMEMEDGFPAHVKVEEPKLVNEDDMKTPMARSVQILDSESSTSEKLTIKISSPPSSSSSSSNASTPPTETSPQLSMLLPSRISSNGNANTNGNTNANTNILPMNIGMRFDSRPDILSPLALEMGTSPPFSMLSDIGPKRNGNVISSPPLSNCSSSSSISSLATDDSNSGSLHPSHSHSQSQIHWPWGLGQDGKERSNEEVKKVLRGIREKSTSSPIRKVSPTFGVGGIGNGIGSGRNSPVKMAGRSSPLKEQVDENEVSTPQPTSQSQLEMDMVDNVVSPQPRMPNWSKVGSGWNRNGVQQQQKSTPSPLLMNVLSPVASSSSSSLPTISASLAKSSSPSQLPTSNLTTTSTTSSTPTIMTPTPTPKTMTTATKPMTATVTPRPRLFPTPMPSFTSGLATPPYSPTATIASSSSFFPPSSATFNATIALHSSPSSSKSKSSIVAPPTLSPSPPASALASTSTSSSSPSPVPVPVPAPGSNHGDSVYQAFVKQWCFAQGPAPITASSPMGSNSLGTMGRFGTAINGVGNGVGGVGNGEKDGGVEPLVV